MYVELHTHSAFTFLEGASLPEHLALTAAELGHASLALTDRDDLGGQVRFLEAARKVGIAPIVGAELTVRATPLFDGARGAMGAIGRDEHDTFGLVLLARDAAGYANLSSLVSLGRFERPRGRPYVTLDEVAARSRGLVALSAFLDGPLAPALRRGDVDDGLRLAAPWLDVFGDDFHLEVQDHTLPEERAAISATLRLAARLGRAEAGAGGRRHRGVVATNHVHHATTAGKRVEDVLRCIQNQRTIDDAGDRLFPNDERALRSGKAMHRRFRNHPELLRASVDIAEQCTFRLSDLQAPLPCFPSIGSLRQRMSAVLSDQLAEDADGDAMLAFLAWEGARVRYPFLDDASDPRAEKHRAHLRHELEIIRSLQFCGYFLILWDVIRAAKELNILVQGRGSAANSAVCYCLGITAVDPIGRDLLFERFLSAGRTEPPDIDIDIEHDQRERLLQYVYNRYGRDHAAMVAAVHTFQPKAAARDVARVLGFSVAQGAALAGLCDRFIPSQGLGNEHRLTQTKDDPARSPGVDSPKMASPLRPPDRSHFVRSPGDPHHDRIPSSADRLRDPGALASIGLDPNDARVAMVPWLVERMVGLPRHRAIHTGGFVLSARPISEVCPVEWASMPNRSILQWEKDDIHTLGIVKFDLLGLGMLAVLHRHLDLIEKHRGQKLDLWELPHDDPDVFDDICAADTVGVFQIESRAQMNTLPRLRPRQFYDLVVEVALIRPGPIQGEMVHPYLRRRSGQEPITYLHPSLEPHLARTLGVPLFQEQGMKVAIAVAGFSPAEADELRRAMSHKRSREAMMQIGERLASRMIERGIEATIAGRIVKQLTAFADYGFPESHAASFALLVYASAYLRHHFMPEFYAAILNAQPMGFYSPASLVEDAKRHEVQILPPDVSASGWDCTIESTTLGRHPGALRIGMRFVRGLGEGVRADVERALFPRPASLVEFVTRSGLPEHLLLGIAAAGAFDSLEPERRRAIWDILRLGKGQSGPLDLPGLERDAPRLPSQSGPELVAADHARIGLSAREHPMHFLRAELDARGVITARALADTRRKQVKIAGLVICRQRPGTAKGFVFLTLEDEGGMVNVVVDPTLFDTQRLTIVGHPALEIDGVLERQDGAINVKAKTIKPLRLSGAEHIRSHDFH